MIVILVNSKDGKVAEAIARDLDEAHKGQLQITIESASSPNPWRDEVSWDDLLITLYDSSELPAKGEEFVAEFLEKRGKYSLILPVSVGKETRRPPEPIQGLKAILYDAEAAAVMAELLGELARCSG